MKIGLFSAFKAMKRNEQGNVLILVSLGLFVLLAASGVAIDMSRMQTTRQKLHECLDTAGLAALAKINETPAGMTPIAWVTQNVTKYFYTDCQRSYLGSTVTIRPELSNNNNTLTLTLTSRQPAALLPAVGIHNLNLAETSVVTRAVTGLEMVLVLDNTLSMGDPVNISNSSVPKIDALKCAVAGNLSGLNCGSMGLTTNGLLNIMYGGAATLPNVFMGVVPFTNMVNINPAGSPGSRFVSSRAGGKCVDSRSATVVSTVDGAMVLPSGRRPTLDISEDRPISASTYFKGLPVEGPDYCPKAMIQPMSLNASSVITTIKQMVPAGNTQISTGLAWGWRMLSPAWSGMWGGPTYTYPDSSTASLPLPYNTANMSKVLILMTDGMNMNGYNPARPNLGCCNVNSNTDNAYQDQPAIPSDTQLDGLTQDVCDAMKAKGITIYTIGFGTPAPSNPPTIAERDSNTQLWVDQSLLKYCASGSDHYFLAPTNAQLAVAFQTIANQLVSLRISQ